MAAEFWDSWRGSGSQCLLFFPFLAEDVAFTDAGPSWRRHGGLLRRKTMIRGEKGGTGAITGGIIVAAGSEDSGGRTREEEGVSASKA